MPRLFILSSILGVLLLALSACGSGDSGGARIDETDIATTELDAIEFPATELEGEELDGEEEDMTSEPAAEPLPTFTPTPEITPTPEMLSVIEDRDPEDAPADLSSDDAGDEVENDNGAGTGEEELDLSVLLMPTPTPLADSETTSETTTEPAIENAGELETAPNPTSEIESETTSETAPLAVVIVEGINIRGGPGTGYDLIGAAMQGEQFGVVGRNPEGDWWQVCCVGAQSGWVYAPLVETSNTENVAVAADIPAPPVIEEPVAEAPSVEESGAEEPATEPEPVALPVEPQPEPPAEESPTEEPVVEEPGTEEPEAEEPSAEEPATPDAAAVPGQPAPHEGTAGNFDPNAQYQIVHYRTLGFDDNNGGIFDRGGQQLIFLTVLDEAGNGIDGVQVKNAVEDNLTVVTGDKGPGKAEIKMDWDPYKLYVAQDGSGPVTSQVSNQMNNPYPHLSDIVGLMGPPDLEYAICPTLDDRCEPPFYHAHWSYEITFQKVR